MHILVGSASVGVEVIPVRVKIVPGRKFSRRTLGILVGSPMIGVASEGKACGCFVPDSYGHHSVVVSWMGVVVLHYSVFTWYVVVSAKGP